MDNVKDNRAEKKMPSDMDRAPDYERMMERDEPQAASVHPVVICRLSQTEIRCLPIETQRRILQEAGDSANAAGMYRRNKIANAKARLEERVKTIEQTIEELEAAMVVGRECLEMEFTI